MLNTVSEVQRALVHSLANLVLILAIALGIAILAGTGVDPLAALAALAYVAGPLVIAYLPLAFDRALAFRACAAICGLLFLAAGFLYLLVGLGLFLIAAGLVLITVALVPATWSRGRILLAVIPAALGLAIVSSLAYAVLESLD